MNPKFKYTGEYQYQNLQSVTHPDGPRVYETPFGQANSVTTVLGLLPAPGLDAWIERVGVQEAERIRDEAAIIGTCMHNRLEAYVKGIEYQPIDSELEKVAQTLMMMIKTSGLNQLSEVWGVEEALYLQNLIAGRTDVLGIYAGKRSVIDYKTGLRPKSDDVIHKYKLQLSLYALCHDWMFADQPGYAPLEQGVILVGIRPNQWSGAKIQKIIVPEAELITFKYEALEVLEKFHSGELGQIGQSKEIGDR